MTFNDRITEAKLSNEIKQLKCGFDRFVVIARLIGYYGVAQTCSLSLWHQNRCHRAAAVMCQIMHRNPSQ